MLLVRSCHQPTFLKEENEAYKITMLSVCESLNNNLSGTFFMIFSRALMPLKVISSSFQKFLFSWCDRPEE
jgi:hypothetical protein